MNRARRQSFVRRGLVPLAAFVYFNLLFSFENLPSTPVLRPVLKISIEALVLVGALAGVLQLGWKPSRLTKSLVALAIFVMSVVRYVDVTALGVLGREFNLHGDFPHLHRVFEMFWGAISPWTGAAVIAGFVGVTTLCVLMNRYGLSVWERALTHPAARRWALVVVALGLVGFMLTPGRPFAFTTSAMIVKQVANLRAGEAELLALETIEWPAPNLDSNLERLAGAHVVLVFLESYGVTLIEDAHHFDAIEPRYRDLETRLEASGYHFRSSQIQSPTFGGGSWRAHATFLSGVQVDSEHIYDALVRSERQTLVSVLRDRGYRTVAAEPGIKWFWPDGEFYGFDEIYAFGDLGYDGPPMGWWKIPDQYTLHRVARRELENAERPVFAKFSLIMSHIPYYPVPPYVEDWTRFDDGTAFDGARKSVAHDAYRDMRELSSWYVEAFRYELDVLEGFLLRYVPDNALTIVIGDHQPPKLVTHDNDSWAVPMHVFSRRAELVDAFEPLGFEPGLVPLSPSALRMADFLERFLEIYHEDHIRSKTDE